MYQFIQKGTFSLMKRSFYPQAIQILNTHTRMHTRTHTHILEILHTLFASATVTSLVCFTYTKSL